MQEPKKILVIDDDEAVLDAFELALKDIGHRVATTSSGEEGLEMARASRPDLVFLDLRMPGMDGIEVLRRVQELDPSIPIYIVTAFHQEYMGQLQEAVAEGLRFEVAAKPLGGAQIREIAGSVLSGG